MIIYIHQLALTFLNYFIACYITSSKNYKITLSLIFFSLSMVFEQFQV